jgi:hypothetical protein
MHPDMGRELSRQKIDDLYRQADAYRMTKPSRAARSAARRERFVELRASAARGWRRSERNVPAPTPEEAMAKGRGLVQLGYSIRQAAHALGMKTSALRRLL